MAHLIRVCRFAIRVLLNADATARRTPVMKPTARFMGGEAPARNILTRRGSCSVAVVGADGKRAVHGFLFPANRNSYSRNSWG